MQKQIRDTLTTHWQERADAIPDVLARAGGDLDAMLQALQDAHRSGDSQTRRDPALGEFAGESMDLGKLSSLLQQGLGARAGDLSQLNRLRSWRDQLTTLRGELELSPPGPWIGSAAGSVTDMLETFQQHMALCARALGLVRAVGLEARGRYRPDEHDEFFARFNWMQLDNAEMAMCPPFVIDVDAQLAFAELLGPLLGLLASGRPVKVLISHRTWQAPGEASGRATALHSLNDVSLLFLALRNTYFVQTSVAATTPLDTQLRRAVDSPRAAVISVFADRAEGEDFKRRAAAALASRAFPHLCYDPDRAPDFVNCLDLADNPDPASPWLDAVLEYRDDHGATRQLNRPLTFADYAVGEAEFAREFAPLSERPGGRPVPLAEYLELDAAERHHCRPFVYAVNEDERLEQLVPSDALIGYSRDRLHLWNTLQELAGIASPLLRTAEAKLRAKFDTDLAEALAAQRERLDAEFAAQRDAMVAGAIRNLASQLTGIPLSAPELSAAITADSVAALSSASVQAEADKGVDGPGRTE